MTAEGTLCLIILGALEGAVDMTRDRDASIRRVVSTFIHECDPICRRCLVNRDHSPTPTRS